MGMNSGVYLITCTCNGHFYVGQSTDMARRWSLHLRTLRTGKHHNIRLQRCFDKYGEEELIFEGLEFCEIQDLDEKEQGWLDSFFGHPCCLNISLSAQGGMRDRKHTTETKIRMSESRMGKRLGHKFGPASQEARDNMSKARKGKAHTKAHKEKLAIHLRELSQTDEHRQRRSRRNVEEKGQPVKLKSPEGDELEFPSLRAAAAHIGCNHKTISRMVKGSTYKGWTAWRGVSSLDLVLMEGGV